MYVIVKTDGSNQYVATPGSKYSYTNNLKNARWFSSKEDAERNRCPENERVVSVNSQLRR